MSEESGGQGAAMAELGLQRERLRKAMEQAEQIRQRLNQTEVRFQSISGKLPFLESAMSPLGMDPHTFVVMGKYIDSAVDASTPLLRSLVDLHCIKETLRAQPQPQPQPGLSFETFLANVSSLEASTHALKQARGDTIPRFIDTVAFLQKQCHLDTYRSNVLEKCLAWNEMVSNKQSNDDALLYQILGNLESEFKWTIATVALLEDKEEQEEQEEVLAEEEETAETTHNSPGTGTRTRSNNTAVIPTRAQVAVKKLSAIVEKLRASGRIRPCLLIFRDARARAMRKRLSALQAKYLNHMTASAVDALGWDVVMAHVEEWIAHIEFIVKVLVKRERALCTKVFNGANSDGAAAAALVLGEVLKAARIDAFFHFGEAMASSQRRPEKLFKLLEMLDCLNKLSSEVEEGGGGDNGLIEIRFLIRELKKKLVHTVSQLFSKDIAVSLRDESKFPPTPRSGGTYPLVSYMINYLNFLLDVYGPLLESILYLDKGGAVLDKGGDAQRENPRKELDKEEEDKDKDKNKEKEVKTWKLVSPIINNILEILAQIVEQRSGMYEDPALAHIFLMNNYWYMFTRSSTSELARISSSVIKDMRGRVNKHALMYKKTGWEKVLANLSREGISTSSSGSRGSSLNLVKQRLKAFNQSFQETCHKSQHWSIPDPELRKGTILSILQHLVPAYRSFLQFTKAIFEQQQQQASNYVQYTPEEVEQIVHEMFPEKPNRVQQG